MLSSRFLRTTIFSLMALYAFPLFAQKVNKVQLTKQELESIAYYKKVYSAAYEVKDVSSAQFALLNIITIDGSDTASIGMLAGLYFENGNFYSSLKVALRYYAINPSNAEIVRIIAHSHEKLGSFNEALLSYTELYYLTNDYYYQYMAAYMQYELFRHVEALKTLEEVIKYPEAGKTNIELNYDENNGPQAVPLLALAHNLQGLVYLDMKEYGKAKDAFNRALSVFPQFKLASMNLQMVQQANGQ